MPDIVSVIEGLLTKYHILIKLATLHRFWLIPDDVLCIILSLSNPIAVLPLTLSCKRFFGLLRFPNLRKLAATTLYLIIGLDIREYYEIGNIANEIFLSFQTALKDKSWKQITDDFRQKYFIHPNITRDLIHADDIQHHNIVVYSNSATITSNLFPVLYTIDKDSYRVNFVYKPFENTDCAVFIFVHFLTRVIANVFKNMEETSGFDKLLRFDKFITKF